MKYIISLSGCDDSTIFYYELTDFEYDLIKKISEKSKEESTYQCMPILEIEKVSE